MRGSFSSAYATRFWKQPIIQDQTILLLSILLQLTLGTLFGHFYDMRIFMATGYLVGNGQNPYVAHDLTAAFQNSAFQGMTSVGYPPPWSLVLGLLYRSLSVLTPNLVVYNLVIKLPVIAANIGLAYLVVVLLKDMMVEPATIRKAWIFMLFSPLVLYFGPAWGQFDAIVALLSLLSLVCLYRDRLKSAAILLALAIAFKPTALPLFPIAIFYLRGKLPRHMYHPKFNLWSDSHSEYTPTPDPSPKLGEARRGKTGNRVLRVFRTPKTLFPELTPPFPPGRAEGLRPQGVERGDGLKPANSPNIKFGVCHIYALWFSVYLSLFCALPFLILDWDITPIIRGWNAHFTVAGGMSFMTFFELLKDTYALPGDWWLLGLVWIPALGLAIYPLRHGIFGFTDLMQKSLGLILVFYLTRAWLSEPNIILVLPLALILTLTGKLNRLALHALWILPLVITVFNASPPQLLFLNFPQAMHSLLDLWEEYRTVRLVARAALVIPWQIAGWWVVATCLKARQPETDSADRVANPTYKPVM